MNNTDNRHLAHLKELLDSGEKITLGTLKEIAIQAHPDNGSVTVHVEVHGFEATVQGTSIRRKGDICPHHMVTVTGIEVVKTESYSWP